jgi:hypothetical protein
MNNQEQPEAARSSHDQPGAAQEQPGAARSSQEQPIVGQEQPGTGMGSQGQPRKLKMNTAHAPEHRNAPMGDTKYQFGA